MTRTAFSLSDNVARRNAISQHDRSMLVEAGAGSGKTAVMAGRIAYMLAEGVSPRSIAAVTFTELAASELVIRVREFLSELSHGKIARELEIAFPEGLSQLQRENLNIANETIDEITCTTIHGFCQRLIKPYPAEANIDPGASITDRSRADLAFSEIVDRWLRERLSGETDGVIAEMVMQNPAGSVTLIHKIAENLRKCRSLIAPPTVPLARCAENFRGSAQAFEAFLKSTAAVETDTSSIVGQFIGMANDLPPSEKIDAPKYFVGLLSTGAHADLLTNSGSFKAYKKKTKWVSAAKAQSLPVAEAERLNDAATACYDACCESWEKLKEAAASRTLAALIDDMDAIPQEYSDYKRNAALLDFDDLIYAARDLLREHEDVRQALGQRFTRVLVDEFQDTDPLQTEIFWRLCGDPLPGASIEDWPKYNIRPGALFLVGDPKQAIYRFRGADVGAYVSARSILHTQNPECLLSISTNFRSAASILDYVNQRFEAVLSAENQPGFTALDPFHPDRGGVCVAALDVFVANEDGKASAEQKRDAEADAIADACMRLIGSREVIDKRTRQPRPCLPGDIALLAPTGSDLWRYEEALERRGIPVATQAGKGLFRRQEIQDLIAITRVLADGRDKLALGALLRGPIVGLTEEELLNIVWSLPRDEENKSKIPSLDIRVEASHIQHPLARNVIEKIQGLYRRANTTTPHDLLSQAVDILRVRPILKERHRGQAERALANVDLYLSLANAYAVRGLSAFAEAMTLGWSDEERAIEGRPDAQEESVALYTMHAAKGLEWPIVMPINTMTVVMAGDNAIVDRRTNVFFCPIFGAKPIGYEEALEAERSELTRERIRLWYVAATRARELLVLPRLDADSSSSAWIRLLDLALENLPSLDLEHFSSEVALTKDKSTNSQTRDLFVSEGQKILAGQKKINWVKPSRDENGVGEAIQAEERIIWSDGGDEPGSAIDEAPFIKGGKERGTILHKLLEEVLTGELSDDLVSLTQQARHLIHSIGKAAHTDPSKGLSPEELAACVERVLGLPEITALRPELLAEFPVYGSNEENEIELAAAGIVDAMTVDETGRPKVVIDWKSDVSPASSTIEHYCSQVGTYLKLTGAERGLIVLLTSGKIIEI